MSEDSTALRHSPTGRRHRRRIRIAGSVQGVGFRPFLFRQASLHGLDGFALNGNDGVVVEVEGRDESVAAFIADIRGKPPCNALVRKVTVTDIPLRNESGFAIRESRRVGAPNTSVLPDLATCDACLSEIFDPGDRRHLYPFTNCTDCGPRYSIIRDLPYDRASTVMDRFPMCQACRDEYENPANRRFHAEPNACPDCGPRLALLDRAGRQIAAHHDALLAAADALRRGRIVALKGLGGFQLIVDAHNPDAVARLRDRKRREAKPFALMFPDLAAVKAACTVDGAEAELLTGRERPILLLRVREDNDAAIAANVAPGNPYQGIMLPYSPLHHILMAELGFPIVATSGNLTDEPIAIDNAEALDRLGGIAELFLVHDREIVRPVDDSVARVLRGRPQILRRARGYAPAPIETGQLASGVLAAGGHLKATVALTQRGGIVLSQHIGDLDSPAGRDAYDAVCGDILKLYRTRPRAIACDLHSDYYATRKAEERANGSALPLTRVQHHLAHVAAGMAEHGLKPPVLGVAWDGTGFGTDGTIWGGEFILATDGGWRRVAHLRPFRLPGGAAAIREPRRAAIGLLFEMFAKDVSAMDALPPAAGFSESDRRVLSAMLERGVNAPVTTSAGRLFDAVASLLDLCQIARYEGEAACRLEWAAGTDDGNAPYTFALRRGAEGAPDLTVDWAPALEALIADREAGRPVAAISARFHAGLAAAIAAVAHEIGVETVMLTGGCFQNARLTERAADELQRAGFRPYWHEKVPPGDGGLALGQAFWAARTLETGEPPCA